MAGVQPLPLCHQLAFARLWLDPIFWTRSHIRKLGCQFENADADHTDYTKATNWINSTPWTRLSMATSPSLTELFALHPNPANRLDCFREILGISGPWERGLFPDERQGSQFVFQNIQPSYWVDYKTFYYRKHMRVYPEENPPRLIGFLDYHNLEEVRKSRFKRKRRRRSGLYEYDEAGLERVTPKFWIEDPFLLFILLGIAQLHRRKCRGASFHKGLMSRLLVHNWKKDPNNIYLYEATFDIDIIDAVMNKSKKAILKQFKVLWRRLPLGPYNSFPDRLHKELLIPLQPDSTPAQPSQSPTVSPIMGPNKDKNILTNSLENLEASNGSIAQSTTERASTEAPGSSENNEKQKEKRRLASSTSWWEKAATREERISSQNNVKRKLEYETISGEGEGLVPVNQPVSGRTRSKTRKVDVDYSTGEPEKKRIQLEIKSNANKIP